MILRAQSRAMRSGQDQRISSSALSLFIVHTSTGRLYAVWFFVGCCLFGLLSGVIGLSGNVAGAIGGVCSGVFIIVVGRRAARYWADIDATDDQP